MSVFRAIASMFSDRILAEETIRKQEEVYEGQKRLYPELEPHDHLAQVWLSRMAAAGHDPHDSTMQMLAYTETMQFACVPPPKCARALALFILYKENERVIEGSVEYQEEFEKLMSPVMKADEKGRMLELYAKYNPKRAAQMKQEDEAGG